MLLVVILKGLQGGRGNKTVVLQDLLSNNVTQIISHLFSCLAVTNVTMDMSSDEEFYDAKEAMSPRDSRNSKLADYLFDKDIGLNFDRNAPSKHDGDRLQPLGKSQTRAEVLR